MSVAALVTGSAPSHVVRSFLNDDCPFLAAAVAYQIFFSLIPLLALVLGVLGFVLGNESGSRELARVMRGIYPSATNEELRIVHQIVAGRAVSLGLGLIGTVLGASAIFGSLDSAVAAVLGRGGAPSLARRYLKALGFVAAVMVIAFASLAASYGAAAAGRLLRSAGVAPSGRTAFAVLGIALGIAAGYLLFLLIYRTVPRSPVPPALARRGALVSAVLWEAAKLGFGAFTAAVGAFTAYGPLAFAAGLLTWIYLTAVIILIGAEVMKIGRVERG
ncbi:MAG: YihY/virulence factor BrkB family protein [Chloroflexota bacterium]|nr:YihY/virulence factor BrkB family protein [Chloroflexota bacterium]